MMEQRDKGVVLAAVGIPVAVFGFIGSVAWLTAPNYVSCGWTIFCAELMQRMVVGVLCMFTTVAGVVIFVIGVVTYFLARSR